MKSPKRKFEPQSIGKILDQIVNSEALKTGITNTRIKDKVLLKGNTIIISLNNAALREELTYGKEKIRKMMNEELGSEVLKKIVLR